MSKHNVLEAEPAGHKGAVLPGVRQLFPGLNQECRLLLCPLAQVTMIWSWPSWGAAARSPNGRLFHDLQTWYPDSDWHQPKRSECGPTTYVGKAQPTPGTRHFNQRWKSRLCWALPECSSGGSHALDSALVPQGLLAEN